MTLLLCARQLSDCRHAACANDDDQPADFFAGVSSHYARENPVPLNPGHSQKRVLAEVALILAGVSLLVLMAGLLAPPIA